MTSRMMEPQLDSRSMLSVVIPVYNEIDTIDKLLSRVVSAPHVRQAIVVDDGSSDGTAQRLARWSRENALVEAVFHQDNRGKGAAIRTALPRVRGEFVLIQDADLEYSPADYPRLLEPIVSGGAVVVYGSRYIRRSRFTYRGRAAYDIGVGMLNTVVRYLYGQRLSDQATCYKVFPTSLLRALQLDSERFEFCAEVTAKVCRLGIQIKEVPISYQPRGYHEGKKIRLTDGIHAIRTLWRHRNWTGTWNLDPAHR